MTCNHDTAPVTRIQAHRGAGTWSGLKLGADQVNELGWCAQCGALLVDGKWLLPERDVPSEVPVNSEVVSKEKKS